MKTLLNPLGLLNVDCPRESHCGCYELGHGCHFCLKPTPLELLRADLIVQALNQLPIIVTHSPIIGIDE